MTKAHLTWILALAGAVLLYVLIWPRQANTETEQAAVAEGRTILVYWDRHQGHEHESRRALIEEFNRSQKEIYIRALPVGYNSMMEKFMTSIAGGTPPDLCSIDSTIMAELVAQGCFEPVEERMAGCPFFDREKFFPFVWDTVCFNGHVWGVPTTTDTYCLLWNKQAFRKAGLDPERPPQTLEELQEYAAKLTIYNADGLQQAGFLPWQPWDMSIMWGLFFGGKWHDKGTSRMVCAGDPALIRMFDWQRSFAVDPNSSNNPSYAIEPQRIQTFQQGFGSYMSANNPFCSGKVAMITEGEWQVTFIPKYAPDLDWGVAPIPMPEGLPLRTYSPACVVDCIPKGCKHPEEAWRFIEWFYSPRPGGGTSPASDYCYAIHNIAPRIEEAHQDRFVNDPKFEVYVKVLTEREVVTTPITPVAQFMADEIERQRERVVYRETTPETALEGIQTKVNKQLDSALRLMGKEAS